MPQTTRAPISSDNSRASMGDLWIRAATAVLLFAVSLVVNYFAMRFAAIEAGNPVTDILLDNLPVVNTDIVFSEGAYAFAIFVAILLISKPKIAPFALKGIALLVIVRSLFVIMTHLGPYPGGIATDLFNLKYLSAGSDLFFSGHTGMPFLLALVFWRERGLRIVFILCSVAAAVAVILDHLHYTIDVFSAYFITYGVYKIAERAFSKDKSMFDGALRA